MSEQSILISMRSARLLTSALEREFEKVDGDVV